MYRPDDALETAGALFVLALAALGLAVLVYVFTPTAAGATECRARPGDRDSYWSYREIDGRRCWYRGHRRLDKSELHWPEREREPEPEPERKPPRPILRPVPFLSPAWRAQALEPEPDLPECCWPPITEFDSRFLGAGK